MKSVWAVAAIAALGLGVTACGSSSSGSDGGSGSKAAQTFSPETFKGQSFVEQTAIVKKVLGDFPKVSGSTTRGVTSKSITVAGITTLTTAQGVAPFPGVCEGAKARFARANNAGGVGGRLIKFASCKDDGGDPARNLQLAQQAVQDQDAFAIVPALTIAAPLQAAPYYNKTHTPYIAGGGEVGTCGVANPYSFPVTGCFQSQPLKGYDIAYQGVYGGYSKAAGIADPKTLRVAYIADDTPIAPQSVQIAELHAQVSGAKMVFTSHSVPPPGAAPLTDYTTLVRQITTKNPNLVYISITNPTAVIGLVGALRGAGYSGGILQVTLNDPRALQNKQVAQVMDGTYALSNMALAGATGGKIPEIEADLTAVGYKGGISYGALIGYGAADLFLDAVSKVKGPLTTEAFTNLLNSGSYTYPGIDGATCPLQFPLHHFTQPPCLSFGKLDAKSKTIQTKLPLTNFPTELVTEGAVADAAKETSTTP